MPELRRMINQYNHLMLGKMPHVQFNDGQYLLMEERGSLNAWGAWCGVDLIGALSYIVGPSRHYPPEHLIALHDLFYVMPGFRGRSVARNLYLTAEKSLREMGVKLILMSDHVRFSSREKVYSRWGYSRVEVTYEKRL